MTERTTNPGGVPRRRAALWPTRSLGSRFKSNSKIGRIRSRSIRVILFGGGGRVRQRRWRMLLRCAPPLRHRLSRHFLHRKFGPALRPMPLLPRCVLPGPPVRALRCCRCTPSNGLALQARALGAAVALSAITVRTNSDLACATPTCELSPDLRRRAHTRPNRAAFWTTAPASAITTRGASLSVRSPGRLGRCRPGPSLFSTYANLPLPVLLRPKHRVWITIPPRRDPRRAAVLDHYPAARWPTSKPPLKALIHRCVSSLTRFRCQLSPPSEAP
jgi:hypothetical protein